MIFDIEEYGRRIDRLIEIINRDIGDFILGYGLSLKDAAVERIQDRGEDYRGKKFSKYNIQYAKYKREPRGVRTNFKDFTIDGDFLNGFEIFVEKIDGEYYAVIAPVNDDVGKILRGNSRREAERAGYTGPDEEFYLLFSSEEELEILQRSFDIWIQQKYKEVGLTIDLI